MTQAGPSISIILPTFNGGRFLGEQLDSILAQTFSSFELLLLDDGSTDSTRQIILQYSQLDDRIRIIPSKGNRGQKQRLIELLEAAAAPLIAISDQDDVWEPTKLERLESSLGNAALAFGRSELIDAIGRPFNRTILELNRVSNPWDIGISLLFRPLVSGHAMVGRRGLITKEAFETAWPYDWLISLVAEATQGITYNDHAIVYHRLHGGNFHNITMLDRINLWRLRPRHIFGQMQRTRDRRLRLLDGLQFLSDSPLVADHKRHAFTEMQHLCRRAWDETGRGKIAEGPKLRRAMLEMLRPLANSEVDWRATVDHVTALTLGLFHPLTLVRLRRLI